MLHSKVMSAGYFALAGVLVGAAATGLVNLILERVRAKADARTARRLLRSEVREALDAANQAQRDQMWPIAWKKTWSQSWATYRRAVAGDMDDREFEVLARTYGKMDLLQGGLSADRENRELSDTDRRFLEEITPLLESSLGLLRETEPSELRSDAVSVEAE
jgi:hypothetical protein